MKLFFNRSVNGGLLYVLGLFFLFSGDHAAPPIEQDVLLDMKKSWSDPTFALASWVEDDDCSTWKSITCDVDGHVTRLSLSTLQLSGSIPTSIGNLTKLQYLDMSSNHFYGPIPSSISNLVNLEKMWLNYNNLSGPIPPSISNLINLVWLHLDGNELTGTIPSSIGNMHNLQDFVLSSNKLSGTIPSSIGNMISLQWLEFTNNQLSGSIPDSFGNLTYLVHLEFSDNKLTGSIPASIGNIQSLQSIYLNYNQLSGSIPSSIGNLANLQQLWLYSNNLSGPIPASIGNLTSLEKLWLFNNRLSGSIPASIGNLESLTDLYLYSNQLSGTIPSSFGNLFYLTIIDLKDNLLDGEIPVSFQNLTNLSYLDLSINNLRGPTIDFSFLENLEYINLGFNGFVGEFKFPNTTNFYFIDLSRNFFNNSFEKDFDFFNKSIYLTYLDLSRNHFSANFPSLPKPTSPSPSSSPSSSPSPDFASFAYNSFDSGLPNFHSNHYHYFGNPSCAIDSSPMCEEKDFSYRSKFPPFNNIIGCLDFNSSELYKKCNGCRCGVSPFIATIKLYDLDSSNPLEFLSNIENIWSKYISNQQVLLRSSIQIYSSFSVKLEIFILDGTNESETSQKMRIRNALTSQVGKSFDLGNPQFPNGKSGKYCILRLDDNIPQSPIPYNVIKNLRTSKNSQAMIIIYINLSVSGFLIISIIISTVIIILRIKREAEPKPKTLLERQLERKFLRRFSFAEVNAATDEFSKVNLLGSGGFGSVYKGETPDGEVWAVKRSKPGNVVTLESFQKEVVTISKVSHLHLIKLLGYCDEMDEKIFVYEFVPNGTLRSHLSPSNRVEGKNMVLSFQQRIGIAVDAAEGLNYLHSFTKPGIIHRDIKSENILLDHDLRAKISDFGLAKHVSSSVGSMNMSHTNIVGTFGYMDPEYFKTAIVSTKTDVYSFGVVLLELITGKPPVITLKVENEKQIKVSLASWVIPYVDSKDILSLRDPLLGDDYNSDVALQVAQLAVKCLERQSKLRPTMEQVVLTLRTLKESMVAVDRVSLNFASLSLSSSSSNDSSRSLSERFYLGTGYSMLIKTSG